MTRTNDSRTGLRKLDGRIDRARRAQSWQPATSSRARRQELAPATNAPLQSDTPTPWDAPQHAGPPLQVGAAQGLGALITLSLLAQGLARPTGIAPHRGLSTATTSDCLGALVRTPNAAQLHIACPPVPGALVCDTAPSVACRPSSQSTSSMQPLGSVLQNATVAEGAKWVADAGAARANVRGGDVARRFVEAVRQDPFLQRMEQALRAKQVPLPLVRDAAAMLYLQPAADLIDPAATLSALRTLYGDLLQDADLLADHLHRLSLASADASLHIASTEHDLTSLPGAVQRGIATSATQSVDPFNPQSPPRAASYILESGVRGVDSELSTLPTEPQGTSAAARAIVASTLGQKNDRTILADPGLNNITELAPFGGNTPAFAAVRAAQLLANADKAYPNAAIKMARWDLSPIGPGLPKDANVALADVCAAMIGMAGKLDYADAMDALVQRMQDSGVPTQTQNDVLTAYDAMAALCRHYLQIGSYASEAPAAVNPRNRPLQTLSRLTADKGKLYNEQGELVVLRGINWFSQRSCGECDGGSLPIADVLARGKFWLDRGVNGFVIPLLSTGKSTAHGLPISQDPQYAESLRAQVDFARDNNAYVIVCPWAAGHGLDDDLFPTTGPNSTETELLYLVEMFKDYPNVMISPVSEVKNNRGDKTALLLNRLQTLAYSMREAGYQGVLPLPAPVNFNSDATPLQQNPIDDENYCAVIHAYGTAEQVLKAQNTAGNMTWIMGEGGVSTNISDTIFNDGYLQGAANARNTGHGHFTWASSDHERCPPGLFKKAPVRACVATYPLKLSPEGQLLEADLQKPLPRQPRLR